MEVSTTALRMLAAVCDNPALVSMFRKCRTQADLDKLWGEQFQNVEGLTKNWEERAGLVMATNGAGAESDLNSMDAVLQEFIDSVRCVGAKLTIAELGTWLNSPDGTPAIQEIKSEFKTKFSKNPKEALVYLTTKASDVLIAGNWI